MGLRIIGGPPGSGKTTAIIREILEENTRDPLGAPLILLVPEQATFQAERLLLSSGADGYVRIEVLSFARLGRWIESRRPRAKRPALTDVHREVIVTGVLARMKREGTREGLANVSHLESSVAALLGEMKQGNVRTNELIDWAGRVESTRPSLARKLLQIAEVTRGFDEAVAQRFEDPQDTMLSLAASVREMTDLQGAHVYVDSFYGFTAVEREVLRGLLAGFPQVTVTLVMDQPLHEAADSLSFRDAASSRSAPSMETLRQLLRLAEQECKQAPELVDVTASSGSSSRFQSSEMQHVAREFLAGTHQPNGSASAANLRMIEAEDIRAQARAAALQVERWHRERKWHWGQMAIIARDVDSVAQELGEALNAFRIPHFMDRNQPEETHPVVQGSLAAMDTVLRGWRQESIFAFAKSGLYGFDEHAVARLEWFALQYPRRESDWKLADAWGAPPERSPFEPGEGYQRNAQDMESLDAIRRQVAAPLRAFEERLKAARGAEDGLSMRAVVEALCHLIHDGIQPQMDATNADGQREKAQAEEKVLAQIGRLLDAVATAAGDEAFEDVVLLDLIITILGKFRLQRIPPLIDQVVVAQADRSRLHEVRGVVVIGLAEGDFPPPGSNRTLLSDEDREVLAQFAKDSRLEKEIKASSRKLFRREAFFAWMAMTRASEALTLIRPCVSRAGEGLKPSPWWIEIERLFDKLVCESTAAIPPEVHVARPREAAAIIGGQWGALREMNPPLPPARFARYAPHFHKASNQREFQRIIDWASRRNEAFLTPMLAREVLGDSWSASATALEAFASCPFKFFMQTLMRPDIKQDTQVSSMDLGNLAHAILKAIFDRLRTEDRDLAVLSDSEVFALVDESMNAPLERLQKAGLFRNHMGAIQAELIREQIVEIVSQFQKIARHARLRNLHTEIIFSGREGHLAAPIINVTIKDGSKWQVPLRGQIDRIDAWGDGWLFVLDYKLSARAINWTEVADGKSVQLPIYLLVLEENREALATSGGKIGGAFYAAITARESDSYRLRGAIASSAAEDLALLDKDLKIISAGKGQDIENRSNGDVIGDHALAALMAGARRLITRNLEGIMGGVSQVHPARVGKLTPCKYCDHRMACRLDYAMNRPRLVPTLKKVQALEKLASLCGEATP